MNWHFKVLIEKSIPKTLLINYNRQIKKIVYAETDSLIQQITVNYFDIVLMRKAKNEYTDKILTLKSKKKTYMIEILSQSERKSVYSDDAVFEPITHTKINEAISRAIPILKKFYLQDTMILLQAISGLKDKDIIGKNHPVPQIINLFLKEIIKYEQYRKQLSDSLQQSIVFFSSIHDIGKLFIKDDLLKFEGIYSDEQRNEMKQHTILGAKLFNRIFEYTPVAHLDVGYNIIIQHHEKFDGSGYPYGLSQENITLEARIVAIADVYDALVSKRVYKRAFTHEAAIDIMCKGKGKHFDPRLIEIFLEIQREDLQNVYTT